MSSWVRMDCAYACEGAFSCELVFGLALELEADFILKRCAFIRFVLHHEFTTQ